MTRLLHASDLHLDLITHSVTDPATGLPSRLLDVGRCWRWACETAIERNVDAMILAGDTFHGPNPSAAALTQFAAGLRILEENEIPVLVIAGNHDRAPHPGQQSVIEAFHDGEQVIAATHPQVWEVAGIPVACLPSVSRHQLMANRPGIARADADQALVDALRRTLDMLRAEGADVLVGHWPVAGSLLGSELDIAIIPEPMLDPADVAGDWYAAFGHIHRAQGITAGAVQIGTYAGSIDRMSFGEVDYTPSVTLVDLDSHDLERIPTPARRFLTIEGHPDAATYSHPSVENAIVRVRYSLSEDEARSLDRDAITRLLYDAGAQQVRIEVQVERTHRPRVEHLAEASGPLDAFDLWMDATEVKEGLRPGLRLAAKELAKEAGLT